MNRWIAIAIVSLSLVSTTGCWKATYTNLYGRGNVAANEFTGPGNADAALKNYIIPGRHTSGWISFYLFGWLPGEVVLASGEICGQRGIREITTQQTFIQGVVRSLAGAFWINIYAPWTGRTTCN